MTDKEIVKALEDNKIVEALECCLSDNPPCYRCKYDADAFTVDECMGKLMKDALDLINRQQAEIERLKNSGIRANSVEDWLDYCNGLKADAIKEFTNKLKTKIQNEIADNKKRREKYERASYKGANQFCADSVYHLDIENTNFEMLIEWVDNIVK